MSSNCIFCKIISGESAGEILHQDDEVVVFKDIKPASKHHYLSVPKQHIININYLKTSDHKNLLIKLMDNGKKVLRDNGGNVDDIRLGFHCPPFNSVAHLHLHVISPASEMSFLSQVVFKPNTWWFQSVHCI
ncbi:histidine triad nucleotide-binding protein 3 isoform X2 [Anoplophora glabripennis]|uniref:histidine triad nucleotide-binding protein 3 isoform X2 n=1 Tax=Anoplophora glabripennis TaxID=217634 RepID=UPI00087367E2|nr:histidine triad nucleotide-binding protein 3 isoform X2 [Anoplophora glabripennis]